MKNKIKVYEVANEIGISSNEIIKEAKYLSINLKSSKSTLNIVDAEKIVRDIRTRKPFLLKKKKKNINRSGLKIIQKAKDKKAFNLDKKKTDSLKNKLDILKLSLQYKEYKISEILINELNKIENPTNYVIKIIEEGRNKNYTLILDLIEDYLINSHNIEEKRKQFLEEKTTLNNELEKTQEIENNVNILDNHGYFEESKSNLLTVKDETSEILQEEVVNSEKWMQKLWDWADEIGIPSTIIKRDKIGLLSMKKLDFLGQIIEYLPDEICKLSAVEELILWDCNLKYLPRDIINLTNLKKLNIRGNKELVISQSQKEWIYALKRNSIVYMEEIRDTRVETADMFSEKRISNKVITDFDKRKEIIKSENSEYSKYIQNIENINFEKIRRYCNNLVNDNKADDMQKDLAKNGKMYKAFIYSSLEKFINELNNKTIKLYDWNCNQGINSMLLLDYIREKQLNIEIRSLTLIESNNQKLERAMSNIESLNKNVILNCYHDMKEINTSKQKNINTINLHILSNLYTKSSSFTYDCIDKIVRIL